MNIEKELDRISDDEKNSIAIDFDGVIHRNSKGFHDGTIYDDAIEGSYESLEKISKIYRIILFTCKANPKRPLINGKTGPELIWDWLEKYGLNNKKTRDSILKKDGSVQHLDFPTKAVFKSFVEITPKEIVLQAAQRQKYIDQSQSLNLMIHPSVPAKDINALYIYAYEEGVKTLYYQFSQSSAQAFSRNILDCASCEG